MELYRSTPGPFGATPASGGNLLRASIPRWRGWRGAPGVDPTKGKRQTTYVSPAGGGGAERRGWTRQRAKSKRQMYPPLAGVARSAGGGPDKGQTANGKCVPRWRGWRGAPGVDR